MQKAYKMQRKVMNPKTLLNSIQYGFSQIAMGTGKTLVTFSGQVGWNAHKEIGNAGDLHTQTLRTLENLKIAMAEAGGTLDNVLSLRIYIVADVMDETAPIIAGLQQYFPTDPPTATWIGVPRLANKDFLIEIEAIALLD
jgi:enamine deaminase RidA (YjgF/YER057c/UK114 family)